MNDRRRDDEASDELVSQADGLLPLELPEAALPEVSANEDEVIVTEKFADRAMPLEIAFSEPATAEDLLAQEAGGFQEMSPFAAELRIEPSPGLLPPSPQEIVFGRSPSPGGLNVGFQPHARRQPIHYEPQPSFETPEDVPGIIRGRYRPGEGDRSIEDLMYRPGDPEDQPRVELLSDSRATQAPAEQASSASDVVESPDSSSERGQTLPRLMVTVSMANARSVFQECIERASQSLGAKFHSACQSTVNDYARERRAAERAASR